MSSNLKAVNLWSKWLRLSHWVMAFGILFLLLSGWATQQVQIDLAFWQDWHVMIGQVVFMAWVLRVVLLLKPGSSSFQALIPDRNQLKAWVEMVKFYITFARFPLPEWFAHNPFWRPIYLLVLIWILVVALSGFLHDSLFVFAGMSMAKLHRISSEYLAIFVLFHILTVFLHDWKGKVARISAMISGKAFFSLPEVNVKPQSSDQSKGQTLDIKIIQPPSDLDT